MIETNLNNEVCDIGRRLFIGTACYELTRTNVHFATLYRKLILFYFLQCLYHQQPLPNYVMCILNPYRKEIFGSHKKSKTHRISTGDKKKCEIFGSVHDATDTDAHLQSLECINKRVKCVVSDLGSELQKKREFPEPQGS